jgi:hypothetical protein
VERAEWVANREVRLAEINRDLCRLAARIEKANGAAKTEATPKLQALREQGAKLNTHLDEAKKVGLAVALIAIILVVERFTLR